MRNLPIENFDFDDIGQLKDETDEKFLNGQNLKITKFQKYSKSTFLKFN